MIVNYQVMDDTMSMKDMNEVYKKMEAEKKMNKMMQKIFYKLEKLLRHASTLRYWTWYAKSLYWMADVADIAREYFSVQYAKEVLSK